MRTSPAKLLSPEAASVIESLEMMLSVDISQIEARHSTNRELTLLRARGWIASMPTLCAGFICWTVARLHKSFCNVCSVPTETAPRESTRGSKQGKRTSPKKRRGGGGAWRCFLHVRGQGSQFTVGSSFATGARIQKLVMGGEADLRRGRCSCYASA